MAYSKTVWNNNTPPDISAENLNKMEQGIEDAQYPDGGSTGQILAKTNDGTGWVDAPTSAEWGNIEGQISEQTDLYSELESKITMPSGGTAGQVLTKTSSGQAWVTPDGGSVDTVNGIQPDSNKNVQTATDLTEAAYEALPSTKESDNVDYYLTDGEPNVATADDIPYTSSQSVKGALDDIYNGLDNRFKTITSGSIYDITEPGIYYLTSAVTDKPTGAGGTYIVGRYNDQTVAGVFVSAYSNAVFQVRQISGTGSYSSLTIETASVSGTTTASGAILVPGAYSSKKFLNARITTGGTGFVIYRGDGYFTVFNNDGTPKANTDVVFDAYFI